MTIFSIVEAYLKSLVGRSIKVYGYKHPKIPRRYSLQKISQLLGGWEYMGEIDVIITNYSIDTNTNTNTMRDSNGEFKVDVIDCSIHFIHDDIYRTIDIPIN